MATSPVVLLIATAGLACDITGWPSTSRHPVAAPAVAPAELTVEYAAPTRPPEDAIRAARVAVVAALSQPAVTVTRTGEGIAVGLPGVVPDWSLVDGAVRTAAPDARRGSVRVVVWRRGHPLSAAVAGRVRSLAQGAAATAEIGEERVTVAFPAASPPDPAVLWRLRRLLAPGR